MEETAKGALREDVAGQVSVSGLDSPHQEKAIHTALEKLEKVKNIAIAGGKINYTYDPLALTEVQIRQAIESSGVKIEEEKTAPASPLIDSLLGKTPPPPQA